MRSGFSPIQPATRDYSTVSSHVTLPTAATQHSFAQARPQLHVQEAVSNSSPPPGFLSLDTVRSDASADMLQAQGLTRIEEQQLPSTPATFSTATDHGRL